jgi:hypothetical protein
MHPLAESVLRLGPWPLQICRKLREPDAQRVAMACVGTFVFKRSLDRAIIKRLGQMRRK